MAKVHEMLIKIGSSLDSKFGSNVQKVISSAGSIASQYEKLSQSSQKLKAIDVKIKSYEKTKGQLESLDKKNDILKNQVLEYTKALEGVAEGSDSYNDIKSKLNLLEKEQKKVLESQKKLSIQGDVTSSELKNEGINTKNLTSEKIKLINSNKDLKEKMDKLTNSQEKNINKSRNQEGIISKLTGSMKGLLMAGAGLFGLSAIKTYSDEAIALANEKIKAETDLQAMLTNTKNLYGDTTAITKASNMLKNYANELETVGVIGDETVIAGQAQLATFQLMPSSIKKLTTGMADMLAKNKGMNATQEDAAGLANLFGKVMTGQVGALSKYGVTLSKNQKKILQTGNEMQRASMLAQILSENYGGANEALGKTDEGKMVIMRAEIEGIKEEFGKGLLPLQRQFFEIFKGQGPNITKVLSSGLKVASSFFKLFTTISPSKVFDLMYSGAYKTVSGIEKIIQYGTNVISTIKNNRDAMNFLKGGILGVSGVTKGAIEISKNFIGWVLKGSMGVKVLGLVLGTLIGVYGAYKTVNGVVFAIEKARTLWATTKTIPGLLLENAVIAKNLIVMGAKATWTGIVAGATGVWTIAQRLLNATMNASPLAKTILIISLLVGSLVYAYKHSDKFRSIVNKLWGKFKDFGAYVVTIPEKIKGIWDGISTKTNEFKDKILKLIEPLKTAVDWVGKLFGGGKEKKIAITSGGTGNEKKIGFFAKGGISNKPAIFGEAGPEMAIPLKKDERSKSLWLQTGNILGLFNTNKDSKGLKEKKSLFSSQKIAEKNQTIKNSTNAVVNKFEIKFEIKVEGAVDKKEAIETGNKIGETAANKFINKLKEYEKNQRRLSFE